MIKHTVTYEDFNGDMVTEELYFHMSVNQLLETELSHEGGLSKVLPEMLKNNDMGEVLRLFKKIVMDTYGKRSNDGKRFNPASKEEAEEFINSPAFDQFFQDITANEGAIGEFITGMMPKSMMKRLDAGQAATTTSEQVTAPVLAGDDRPAWVRENRLPDDREIRNMSQAEMLLALKMKTQSGQPAE